MRAGLQGLVPYGTRRSGFNAMRKEVLAIAGVFAMATSSIAQPDRDAREILQLLLNDRRLAQYYHFDKKPERAPLKIVNRAGVDIGGGLTAAGKNTTVVTSGESDALEIRTLNVGADGAKIGFAFRAEGIHGEATFSKSPGGWTLGKVDIRER